MKIAPRYPLLHPILLVSLHQQLDCLSDQENNCALDIGETDSGTSVEQARDRKNASNIANINLK